MFEQKYEPLCKELGNLGRVALVPWDIETFGFGVADYDGDSLNINSSASTRLREELEAWTKTHEIELIGTTVPTSDTPKLYFLQSLGFRYIDTTLVVRYENVQITTYPSTQFMVKPGEKKDLEPVIQICEQAFNNGRYHADPCFPTHLANKRYQKWASRTLAPENPQILLVAKISDQVRAFSIIQITGEKGYLSLNAIATQWQGKKLGRSLIASTMHFFQQQNVDMVLSKISAANIRAINLHASLGARFHDPRILLHWHAPWATHLKKTSE